MNLGIFNAGPIAEWKLLLLFLVIWLFYLVIFVMILAGIIAVLKVLFCQRSSYPPEKCPDAAV